MTYPLYTFLTVLAACCFSAAVGAVLGAIYVNGTIRDQVKANRESARRMAMAYCGKAVVVR